MKKIQKNSRRHPLYAKNGMVITGNVLASQAGLQMLMQGGNAIDAAIATAAMLTVVEPTANGLGSDCFAIVWIHEKLYGLNASGKSPALLSKEKVLHKHQNSLQMPKYGWTPVTVPGAVSGWQALSKRFGKLPFAKLLAPAIEAAKHGFPLQQETARLWLKAIQNAKSNWQEPCFDAWFSTFDLPVEEGKIVKLPQIADALEKIAKSGGESLYTGQLAQRIEEESIKYGGFLRESDLEQHQVEWVEPLFVNYRGYQVYELPPNGQGITALMALNALACFDGENPDLPHTHLRIEAIKQAFAYAKRYISDPKAMNIDPSLLIDAKVGQEMASRISLEKAGNDWQSPHGSGTVYLCTADREGNMVSMIQSNYMGFGSGIVVDGVSLQNRGADFSLDENEINFLCPNKRTYHTIIPGFLCKAGKAIGPFGVMGGYMQPQGHVQVITNLLDEHLDIQESLDAPRWMWLKDNELEVETDFDPDVIQDLKQRGHLVKIQEEYSHFGRGQILFRLENGVYMGACESRTDSNISCY